MAQTEPETPALRTLRSRIQSTLLHFELVDASLTLAEMVAGKTTDKKVSFLKAIGVQGKYETLQLPATQYRQICNFARGENLEAAIQGLFTHFMDYLRGVLPDVHRRFPLPFLAVKGEDRPNWERALQRYEGRGGLEALIGGIIQTTGIAIDPEVGREAHTYLAMRDLHVYNNGLVDEDFARLYGAAWSLAPGNKLPRNVKIGRSAMRAVEKFALQLDAALRKLGAEEEAAPADATAPAETAKA
jgi:hypothetical protein